MARQILVLPDPEREDSRVKVVITAVGEGELVGVKCWRLKICVPSPWMIEISK